MESLLHRYNRTEVLYDLDTFLTDFTFQESAVPLNEKKYESIDKAYCLGETPLFSVFEVHHHHVADARVALTKQAVEIMKSRQKFTECALFFFVPKNSDSFRISLVTVDWADNKKASNPRRFSFLVGENQKIHTASQQLSSSVRSREDLLKRFSIEVVNDEFYKKISEHFENLLKQIDYPNVCEQAKQEEAKRNFAVRLIGRLIFCWFLKKKLRQDGSPLIPESLLSSCIVGEYDNYYHDVLEPLFFETLNKPFEDRIAKCKMGDFQNIPFLNGGLFEAHLPEDGYKYDKTTETCFLGASVTIQNNWFINFFETLETYNFTIDENTSTDIDLAVDPEMLGRIFENLLASINPETKESVRKATGSYYTPREIVDYMVTQSLKQYLYTKTDISHGVIDSLFDFEDGTISDADKQKIQKALLTIKVLDPAVGSGAFPMGMLQKMLAVLNRMGLSTQNSINKTLDYQHKLDIIQHCIYGVDIQPMAIEICRLRFFLTLIVDESSDDPQPLPNLNFNFACANSLVALDNNDLLALKQEKEKLDKTIKERESLLSCGGQMLWNLSKEEQSKIRVQKDEIKKLTDKQKALVKKINAINVVSFLNGDNYIEQLRAYRKEFFTASGKEKEELKQKFLETQEEMFHALKANDWGNDKVLKLQTWKPFDTVSTPWFDPFWMLGVENGFDIIIANPPYISTKDVSKTDKETYEKAFGFSDDTYNLFTFKGLELLKSEGTLSYIIPKTFWTIQTKRNMRDLILGKTVNYIFDTANPFDAVMVDTCIIQVSNKPFSIGHKIEFLDGSKDLNKPIYLIPIEQQVFCNAQNAVIFKPTELNLKIYKKYGEKVKELYNTWWKKIETSKKIAKNSKELDNYRQSLKPGDITLLGCLTDGGVGLQTGNNGKYIAVRKKTKWADNIIQSRPKKLAEAIRKYHIPLSEINNLTVDEFLTQSSEKEIAAKFDYLKEKYGRDIFSQGYIYRIIEDRDIADVDTLTDDEKTNGIDISKKYYVPYDKGDKDGNRWYLETPFAIAWSKENVHFLKTDSKARYQGYSFFFKEGFCWNNVLLPTHKESMVIKARLKGKTVNDVASMSLYSMQQDVPNFYFVALLTSAWFYYYLKTFINNTVNIQINDIRQLPIIIPSDIELKAYKHIFGKAYALKKRQFKEDLSLAETERLLINIQQALNEIVYKLHTV